MFDPAEFLLVASGLLGESGRSSPPAGRRGRVRTAYGRIYYALYLLVRQELERRHRIPKRRLQHGTMYTRLQSPRATEEIRQLGRDLERLYALRQKADYEVDPVHVWRTRLENEHTARDLVAVATDWAATLPRLDFSPVAPLF